jgi:hypothetical protein
MTASRSSAPVPLAARRGGIGGRRSGFLATALRAAASWLVEPADPRSDDEVAASTGLRPVVAVFGLARGCGATVVARALAAELASRDVAGAAAVHSDTRASGIPLATRPAARLAKLLADVPGGDTRAVGRLCLVGEAEVTALAETARHFAPVVLDAGSTAIGGTPAAVADHVVLVATPATEPALATVAAECLSRLGQDPIIVLNRAHPGSDEPYGLADGVAQRPSGGWSPAPPEAAGSAAASAFAAAPAATEHASPAADTWSSRNVHRLPDSRMGAQLAAGGREPRGQLGRAVEGLADLCGAMP